jgi:hypothetical protein
VSSPAKIFAEALLQCPQARPPPSAANFVHGDSAASATEELQLHHFLTAAPKVGVLIVAFAIRGDFDLHATCLAAEFVPSLGPHDIRSSLLACYGHPFCDLIHGKLLSESLRCILSK